MNIFDLIFCQLLCVWRSEVTKVVQAGEMKPTSIYWLLYMNVVYKLVQNFECFFQLGLRSIAHDIVWLITVTTSSYLKLLMSSTSTVGKYLPDWLSVMCQSVHCLLCFIAFIWRLSVKVAVDTLGLAWNCIWGKDVCIFWGWIIQNLQKFCLP